MKKYVFIFVSVLLLGTMLTGCYYNGGSSAECKFHTKTIKMQVASNEWQFDQNEQRWYCHFKRSDITSSIYQYGSWTISREYNSGTNTAFLVALPESVYKTEVINNAPVYYTQHIDYAVGIGWVEITLTNSDHIYAEDTQGYLIAPEAMTFVMQITY